MSAIRRRAFGATEVKVALAALFLVAAVSVAAWRLVGNKRPVTSPRADLPAGQAVTDEGEAVSTNYTKVRSAGDVGVVMTSFADDVGRSARSLDLSGGGDAQRVASAARDAIEPMLLGDHDAFVASVQRLGGTVNPDERSRLFDQLAAWMKMGEPDLDRITVRPFEGMGGEGGEAQPRRVSRVTEDDGGGDEGPGVAQRTMAMRSAGNYPDADPMAAEGPTPIEVRVPVRPKAGANKGGEVTVGVVLVWNEQAGAWQPGMYSMTTVSVVDGEGP